MPIKLRSTRLARHSRGGRVSGPLTVVLLLCSAFASPSLGDERREPTARDDRASALRLTLAARPGEDEVRQWTAPQAGTVRLVGELRKLTAGAGATLRVQVGGSTIWTRRFAAPDTIRQAVDLLVEDLDPDARVEFLLSAPDRPVELSLTLQVVPEPLVSRWAPDLPTGYPSWTEDEKARLRTTGQATLRSIRAASDARQGRIVIPPGDYLFPADWSRASTLHGLEELEIVAEGATFWFEPPLVHGLLFDHCRAVAVRGLTIDFTLPCWFQAEVTAVDRDRNTVEARLMEGYEPRTATGQPEQAGRRTLIFYDARGRFLNHRHSPAAWRLADDGRRVVCHAIDGSGIPPALAAGDFVAGTLRTGAALRSRSSSGMRFDDVRIWSSPGMAVNEDGGAGGNVYRRVRATRRPATNRLHAFGADVFHLADTDRGPTLERCEMAYGADDVLNIHGRFGRVVQKVDERRYHLEGAYQQGDVIEFWDHAAVLPLGRGTVVAATPTPTGPTARINDHHLARGEWLVEFAEPLALPVLSLVVMDGKRSAAGFIVRDCWMHDTFQRVLINGAPGGLVEGNTFQNLGHGLVVQFETWGRWMEGPFARDLCIRNNRFLAAPPTGPAISVAMHPFGGGSDRRRFPATPLSDLTIVGNFFDRTSGPLLEIDNVKGLTISGNSVLHADAAPRPARPGPPATPPWCLIQDCEGVLIGANETAPPVP